HDLLIRRGAVHGAKKGKKKRERRNESFHIRFAIAAIRVCRLFEADRELISMFFSRTSPGGMRDGTDMTDGPLWAASAPIRQSWPSVSRPPFDAPRKASTRCSSKGAPAGRPEQ